MPTEQIDQPATTPIGAPPQPINQPTNAGAVSIIDAPDLTAEEPPDDQEDKVHRVKHSDFKRIKDDSRAKGKAEALSELEQAAKAAGYESLNDAMKNLKELKTMLAQAGTVVEPQQTTAVPPLEKTPPSATETKPAMPTTPDPKTSKELQRLTDENARLTEERARERKNWRAEERKRREYQRQLDAKDAEMGLREEMYQFGVTDVDYGLRLLTRELEGKSEDEISAFDRKAFFDGVRGQRPYLFGEKVTAATTGTNGADATGTAPAAPAPGAAAGAAAAAQQFNARDAKPTDVQARLKALGLNPHL